MSAYSDLILATTGLVNYWRLGESASPFADSKGAEALTVTGSGSTFAQPGGLWDDANGAWDTTGSVNASARQSAHTAVMQGADFSVELWAKWTSTTDNLYFFSEGNSASNNPIMGLRISNPSANNQLLFFARNLAATADMSCASNTGVALSDGFWHHIVVVGVRASNSLTMYVDGVAQTAVSTSWPTGTYGNNQFAVGGLYRIAASNNAPAVYDECALYTSALSAGTVLAHYRAGHTSFDTGTGVEAATVAAAVSDADTGAGVDTEAAAAAVSDTETGTGVDAGESVAAALTDTETGTAVEAGAIASTLTDTETGASAEAEAIAAAFTDGDTATGVDTESVLSFAPQTDDDSGTGTDTEAVSAAVTDTETGASAEASAITVDVHDDESGTGVDSGSESDHPAVLPLSITYRVLDNPAGIRSSRVHVVFTTSYTSGGEILEAVSVGLPDIHFAVALPLGFGYEVQWVSGKLMVFQAGVEVAQSTDLSSLVVEVIAYFTG